MVENLPDVAVDTASSIHSSLSYNEFLSVSESTVSPRPYEGIVTFK